MPENSFFDEQEEQSLVKTTIVSKYFDVWSTVMISNQKRFPQHTQKLLILISLLAQVVMKMAPSLLLL